MMQLCRLYQYLRLVLISILLTLQLQTSTQTLDSLRLHSTDLKEAFTKDDNAYIIQILAPKAITSTQTNIDWQRLDVGLTTSVGITSHLYLFGFNTKDNVPPVVIQGYRVGAQTNDSVFVDFASVNDGSSVTGYGVSSASIFMVDNEISTTGITSALGTTSSIKKYTVQSR